MLRLEGVRLSFDGATALDAVDLHVAAGETLGLIGPNGSGKTSLFNAITGIYHPEAGQILLRGENIVGRSPHQIVRLGVARTIQSSRPFERLAVLENVSAIPGSSRREAFSLLEAVGLARHARRMAGQLGFAERRRLDLARSLALKPQLLLLDEPASGLTEAECAAMVELLSKVVTAGRTVVIVEHKLDLISALCSRVAVMNLGKVMAEGTADQIAEDTNVRKVYFGTEGLLHA